MRLYETEHYGYRGITMPSGVQFHFKRHNLQVRAYQTRFYRLRADKHRYFLHDFPIHEVEVRYMNEFSYRYSPDFPRY